MKTLRSIRKELEADINSSYLLMAEAVDKGEDKKALQHGDYLRITYRMLQIAKWSRKWTGLAYGLMLFNMTVIAYLLLGVGVPVHVHMITLLFMYVGMLMYDGYVWDRDYRRLREVRNKVRRIE